MSTGELDVVIDVAAPPQAVWDYVTTWQRQGEWIPFTRVRVEPDGVVVARTAIGPIGFDDTMEVTTWDPPRLCETLHTGWLVKGTGIFAVEPHGAGSRFTWGERAVVPGGPLAPMLWWLARPVVRWGFGIALRRLRVRVERGG